MDLEKWPTFTIHNLFLIKEHTEHVSVQVLPPQPSSPMAWKFPCLEPWIQEPDVQENGTAQTLQTFLLKVGELFPSVLPESIPWLLYNMN